MNCKKEYCLTVPYLFLILLGFGVIAGSVFPLMNPDVMIKMKWLPVAVAVCGGLSILLSIGVLVKAKRKWVHDKDVPPPPLTAVPLALNPAEKNAKLNEHAVLLLSLLQEKGRFLDFVMEEITTYSDEQVGAAARVIHQGCRELIQECFNPVPVCPAAENTPITLEKGFSTGDFRLVGNVSGEPPYQGQLIHKGWRAKQVKLPRQIRPQENLDAPVILPAEVQF